MKPLVIVAALMLSACATVAPHEQVRPLTPAELRAAVGDGVICLEAPEVGACTVVIAPLEITDTSMRIEARDVFEFDSYVRTVLPIVGTEAWTDAHRPLFAELSVQRAAGNYELVRTVEYREGLYDPAISAWCTQPRAEPRVFSNAQMSFALSPNTNTSWDSPIPPETVRRLGVFVEDLLNSDAIAERIPVDEIENFRSELRGTLLSCTTYFGIVRDGRVELRGSGDSWPGEVARMSRPAFVSPAGAELRFAMR